MDEIIIPELEEAPDICTRKAWNDEEEAILIKYFGRKDPALIAQAINKRYGTNRSANGVNQKAQVLKQEGRL